MHRCVYSNNNKGPIRWAISITNNLRRSMGRRLEIEH